MKLGGLLARFQVPGNWRSSEMLQSIQEVASELGWAD